MIRIRRGMGGVAAALFALLLLSYASVQSAVMQAGGMSAGMSSGMSSGASMPGMGGGDMSGADSVSMAAMDLIASSICSIDPRHEQAPASHRPAPCPYCSAAANPPLIADVTPMRVPTAFVFVAFRTLAGHGPRGPPAFEPRARGPPSSPRQPDRFAERRGLCT